MPFLSQRRWRCLLLAHWRSACRAGRKFDVPHKLVPRPLRAGFYCAPSWAQSIVNLSQTAMVTYSILGARYGFGKSMSALLATQKDALRSNNDNGRGLD